MANNELRYMQDFDLTGARVFIRADLNVPLTKSGEIADDTRIKASLETIEYALQHNARVVLASHLGRPKGKVSPEYSLRPVAAALAKLISYPVEFVEDCVGEKVEEKVSALKNGQLLLLENLRFYKEEEANDEAFAKSLSKLCDIYVNDAFATAHRAHASTAGICSYVDKRACGFTPRRELEYFSKALDNPRRPLVAILGGAKITTKIKVINNVSKKADVMLIGGAMANTFFAAQGYEVGKSLVELEQVALAREILESMKSSSCRLVLPVDATVASKFESGVPTKHVPLGGVGADEMIVDIGPKSVELFKQEIASAGTVVWNGPVGAFEIEEFSNGTFSVAKAMADSPALTVVGGGDTDLALHKIHVYDKMSYVSTAGGAFLELLEGCKLPAIEALK